VKLLVENDSAKHASHAAMKAQGGDRRETHFKCVLLACMAIVLSHHSPTPAFNDEVLKHFCLSKSHADVYESCRKACMLMHSVLDVSEPWTCCSVEVVSAAFEGAKKIERHKMVYSLLDEELANGLHALSMKLIAPSEVL
jgi:stress-induced morphogen